MIKKIEIAGIHTEVTDDLRKYIVKKISKLDQYMPKNARESAHVEVKLKEQKVKTTSPSSYPKWKTTIWIIGNQATNQRHDSFDSLEREKTEK